MSKNKRSSERRPWHALSIDATCDALTGTEQGLSRHEARQRLTHYGFNRLAQATSRGPLKRFFSQFH